MSGNEQNDTRERQPYLLVVDDDLLIQEVLQAKLEKSGYRIEVASDGMEALKKIESEIPDLILLDINMPGMDGYEVCRKIREIEAIRTLPILMLTAYGGLEHIVKGLEAGADDYITKPFEIEEVLVRIKSILRMRQMEKDLREKETELAKIETIGQLMVTMAHHINNALTSIGGRAQSARADNPVSAQKLIDVCLKETRRINAVIKSLEDIANHMKYSTVSYAGIENAMIDIEKEIALRLAEISEDEESD